MRTVLYLIGILLTGLTSPLHANAILSDPPGAWADPDREMMIPVEGGNVWVGVFGTITTDTVPVVFVHGGPGGHHVDFGAMTALSDERPVIFYDQLGGGLSDRPVATELWRVDRFVDELEIIRQHLQIRKWHIVAHSWGSALAIEYAAKHPEQTASAMLTGPFLATADWIEGANLLIGEMPEPVRSTLLACVSEAPPSEETCAEATSAFYAVYNGRPDTPEPSQASISYRDRFGGQGWNWDLLNTMWGSSDFSATGSLIGYDATPLLDQIRDVPLSFVVGQYDEAHHETVRDYANRNSGSEFGIIPGASHAMFREQPDVVGSLIRSWLQRVDNVELAQR